MCIRDRARDYRGVSTYDSEFLLRVPEKYHFFSCTYSRSKGYGFCKKQAELRDAKISIEQGVLTWRTSYVVDDLESYLESIGVRLFQTEIH